VKQHLRHCLFFAFQLKNNIAEAKEMICSALENAGKDAVSCSNSKNLRVEIWISRIKNA